MNNELYQEPWELVLQSVVSSFNWYVARNDDGIFENFVQERVYLDEYDDYTGILISRDKVSRVDLINALFMDTGDEWGCVSVDYDTNMLVIDSECVIRSITNLKLVNFLNSYLKHFPFVINALMNTEQNLGNTSNIRTDTNILFQHILSKTNPLNYIYGYTIVWDELNPTEIEKFITEF